MSGVPQWVTTILCPLLGTLISNALALAPTYAVLEVRAKKDIGKLNPIPFALLLNSQLGWTIYGVFIRDFFIFFSNAPPLIFTFLLSLTVIHALERGPQNGKAEKLLRMKVEKIMLISALFWLAIVFICAFVIKAADSFIVVLLVGIAASLSTLLFLSAPLACVVETIKTKDSASLFFPTIAISLLNSALWFVYGLIALNSPIVYAPNGIGFVLCAFELIIIKIYPPQSKGFDAQVAEDTYHEIRRLTVEVNNVAEETYRNFRKMTVTARRPSMAGIDEEGAEPKDTTDQSAPLPQHVDV